MDSTASREVSPPFTHRPRSWANLMSLCLAQLESAGRSRSVMSGFAPANGGLKKVLAELVDEFYSAEIHQQTPATPDAKRLDQLLLTIAASPIDLSTLPVPTTPCTM